MNTIILTHIGIIMSCMVPAMIANALPVILRKIPIANTPIRLSGLGAHKTRRGLIGGVMGGTLCGYPFLVLMQDSIISSGILHFYATGFTPLLMSFLLSFGALFGDSFKSYRKRRYRVAPGQSFMPRDQIDYIIGTFLFTCWWINWSYIDFLSLCFIGGLLSYVSHYIGYALGFIDTKH